MIKDVRLVISAPSGAGKTSVIKRLLQRNDDLCLTISNTTRKKRSNEIDEKDYYFISNDEFLQKLNNDEFSEHAKVYDNFYGTLKSEPERIRKMGKVPLYDIDGQGFKQIKQSLCKETRLVGIYLLPPSIEELHNRFIKRGEDSEIVKKRMSVFLEEIKKYKLYDYVIINDKLESTVELIEQIFSTENRKEFLEKERANIFIKTLESEYKNIIF